MSVRQNLPVYFPAELRARYEASADAADPKFSEFARDAVRREVAKWVANRK